MIYICIAVTTPDIIISNRNISHFHFMTRTNTKLWEVITLNNTENSKFATQINPRRGETISQTNDTFLYTFA